MTLTKTATTTYPVLDLIKQRWSTRSFSDNAISKEALMTLIEAAGWMFSANNEQPWRYITAQKNTTAFDAVLQTLMPGNAAWAKNAAAFIVAVAKTDFDKEGHPANHWAEHDLGAANAALVLQATSMNIYAHLMAGFDAAKIKTVFELGDNMKPVVVIALGYKDEPEKLDEPFKSRELAPRKRKALNEIIL
ncbi:MAG TPA: nitroreductase family protein [Ferruginibacter sp.]|nr:nitroreductase family protein [Ferruginibacter sp.]HMP22330.1 nitroreductase family protein [Ferruginibacter sp.]